MGYSSPPEAGQFFLIATDASTRNPRLPVLLRTVRPAGVLFSLGRLRSPEETAALVAAVAKTLAGTSVLGLDAPPAAACRFGRLLPPLPSLSQAAAAGGWKLVRRLGELHAEALRTLGFNVDFGVMLDLAAHPVAQRRVKAMAFSSEPAQVASGGQAFVKGLRRRGVLACAWHFPGEGSASALAGSTVPLVDKTMADLWREDLLPFRHALPYLRLVGMSNAAFKAYDFDVYRPAALSPSVAQGLLRVKLRYTGIVVADLRGLRESSSLGQEAAAAFKAGCDLLVVPERVAEGSLAEFSRALETGKIAAARADSSRRRLRSLHRQLARPSDRFAARDWQRLVRQFEHFRRECPLAEAKLA